MAMPRSTNPKSAETLATVKTFWIHAPVFTPKMLMIESAITTRIATRFWVLSPTSMLPRTMGPMWRGGTFQKCRIQFEEEMEGMKMPEPIMEPITSMVALVRPSSLTSSLSWWEWMSQSVGGGVLILVVNIPPGFVPKNLEPQSSQRQRKARRDASRGYFSRGYFNLRCAKILLLIGVHPVTDRISPPRNPRRRRSPGGSWRG